MWFTYSSLVDVQDVKLALIRAPTSGLSLQNKQSLLYYVLVGLTATKTEVIALILIQANVSENYT